MVPGALVSIAAAAAAVAIARAIAWAAAWAAFRPPRDAGAPAASHASAYAIGSGHQRPGGAGAGNNRAGVANAGRLAQLWVPAAVPLLTFILTTLPSSGSALPVGEAASAPTSGSGGASEPILTDVRDASGWLGALLVRLGPGPTPGVHGRNQRAVAARVARGQAQGHTFSCLG